MTTDIKSFNLDLSYYVPNEEDINIFKIEINKIFTELSEKYQNDDKEFVIPDRGIFCIRTIDTLDEKIGTLEMADINNILAYLYHSNISHAASEIYEYIFDKNHKLYTNKIVIMINILPNLPPDNTWMIRYINFLLVKDKKHDTSILYKSTITNEQKLNQCIIS